MMDWNGIVRELRSHGLKVRVVEGWKTRGWSGTFSPEGLMWHHTASNRRSGNAPALGFIATGSPIAPLSQVVFGRDGTVFLVARGKANHGGLGGPHKWIPKDAGNVYAVGFEIENDGIGEPYSRELRKSIQITSAVFLRRMKRSAHRTTGHKNYAPRRKIDPTFAVGAMRRKTRTVLRAIRKAWRKKEGR